MGEVAIVAVRIFLVCGVVPVFIGRVHNVAIGAGGWLMSHVSRRIGHPDENAQGDDQRNDANNEGKFGHEQILPGGLTLYL